MRMVKVSIRDFLLLAVLLALMCQTAVIATSATSIDFWLTQKGSVCVPRGWCQMTTSDYSDGCLGPYMYSGAIELRPSDPDGSRQGYVCVTAADFQPGGMNPKTEAKNIMANWKASVIRTYSKNIKFLSSTLKLARVGGGSYSAQICQFADGDELRMLIVCVGGKTRYKKGMRYEGLAVTPVYCLQADRSVKSKQGSADVQSILRSLKLP